MSQIDDFLSGKPSGSKSEIDGFLGEDKPKGGFGAAAKQAVGAVVKGAGQAVEDFAPDAVGKDNAIKRYGQGVIDANPTAVTSGQDILDSPWTAVKEAVGNAAGSMGPMLGARALGMGVTAAAPLTGPFAPATALAGQAIANVGPFVAAALPSFGGIREKQIEKDPNSQSSTQDKAVAALGAGTVGLIEGKFGPEAAALKMMTQQGRAALGKKFAETTLAKGIGYGALKGAAVEGAEELAQNPIEQLAAYDDPRTPENIKDTLFGGAMGAIGGGVLGGGVGAVNQVVGKKRDATVTPQPADTQPADPLLIGNTPDPYLSFADGTVARKSEIDAYIGGLPEDQQPAARAKIMGLAPQPADTTDQASQEAAASLDASRDQAIESGGLVPDLPAKPSEAMGLAPTAGPSLANAAILSVDTGIHQAATEEADPYNTPLSALGQELSRTNQRLRQEADALGLDTEGLHGDAARMTDGKPHEDYLMAANDQLRKAMKAAKEIPDEGQRSGSDDPAPGGEAKGPDAQAGKAPAGNAAGPVGAGAVRPSVDRVGEHGQRAAGTDGGNLPGAVGATSSGPASAGIGQAPQTISQPSPGSDQRQPNTAEPAPGTPKSGAQSEPAPVAVQGVGSGSSSGNNTTGTTRDQAIAKASDAAGKVLASGGTDADANRAATDSLIDQMANTPDIAIAQDAPAAVKAAKAKPPANNNAQTITSAPAAPAAGLPAAGSVPVQAAGVKPSLGDIMMDVANGNAVTRVTKEEADKLRSELGIETTKGTPANVPQPGTQASQTPSTQGAAPAGAAVAKPKNAIQKRIQKDQQARADYFTPGNIVKSYSGHDRVIGYAPPTKEGGAWSVRVQSVVKQGDKWVNDPKDNRERQHSTPPDAKELASGPVFRNPVQPQGATSEPQADQAQQAEAQRPQEPAAAAEPVAAGEALQSAMGAAGWSAEVAGSGNTIWTKRAKKDRYTAILTPESNSMEITVLVDTVDTQIASFKVADPKDAAIAANKAVSDDVADSVPAVANPKIKAAPDKKNEADAEPVAARTATEHAGMKIYPTKVKVGDAVVDMWGVQTKDNARREKNGERQIGGDPLSETLDGAKKNAEAEVRDAKSRAEREAERKAADDAAQAKKDANKGKSILQRRADALLDKQHTYPPQAGLGQGTRREAMQKAVDQGRAIVERMAPDTAAKHRDQTAIDLVKARGYILGLSNENIPVVKQGLEAQARMKANQYEKPEYRVYDSAKTDGGFYEITKTEFDYAKSLEAKPAEVDAWNESERKSAEQDEKQQWVYDYAKGLKWDEGSRESAWAKFSLVWSSKDRAGFDSYFDAAMEKLPQPTPATPVHQDPGSAPEAATAPVIAESLQKAAKKEERPLAEMKAELLGMIDAAIKETPNYQDYLDAVEKFGKEAADGMYTNPARPMGADTPDGKGRITFDVPGDGKFRVTNSYAGLMAFRAKINKASGNGFSETKRPGLPASTSVKKGSTNQISAIESMLEDGDLQAAKDYMTAVGIGTDGMSKSALARMEQLEALGDKAQEALYTRIDPEWQYSVDNGVRRATLIRTIGKDVYRAHVLSGTNNKNMPDDFNSASYGISKNGAKDEPGYARNFHDALVMVQTALEKLEAKSESQDALASKAKDTGWNMAGTGYAGKRYSGRNMTLEDGREVVARIYENAGIYEEAEVKVNGKRVFAVTDRNDAQGKADNFIKTLTGERSESVEAFKSWYNRSGHEIYPSKKAALAKWMKDGIEGLYDMPGDADPTPYLKDWLAKDSAPAELNLMGFTKTPTGNGTFTLSDSNIRVTVEPTGTGFQARMGSGTSGPRLTEQQAIEWAATMRDESIRIQKAEAKAKPEVSKTGKLPVFPVDAYRLERFYANGAKIKPLPARTFSLQEVQSITDWFKSIGWSVTSGSGGNGINATNDIGMTIDDLPEPYTAAQRKKDEALLASDERAAAKKKEQEGYLTSTAAGKFVAGMFGDAMNRYNQVALAKVLSGDEKTFAGLFSNSAADVLSEAGISAEGREIKDVIRDIKAMFDAAPTSTAKEPWQMTEAEFGEVERQKALANIKYDLERAKNGSLKPFVSGDKSKPALVRRLTAEVAQIEAAKPEGYAGDHLAQINKALREGKPVPEVNLKRYDIAAPKAEQSIANQTFDQWVRQNYEDNEYKDAYLKKSDGDEKIAMLRAATGWTDADAKPSDMLKEARRKYFSELTDQPREASISLEVFDALSPAMQPEAQRHFYDLDSRLTRRTQDETSARVKAENAAKKPYEDALAEVSAEIARLDKISGPETQKQKDLSGRRARLEEAIWQIGQGKEPDGRLLKKDAPTQARRTNPAQTIEFKNPIVGPSGEKLVSYTWQWKPFEYVDKTGEERTGKLSDWDKSAGNVDTGREVVHQFTVESKDGETRIVSAESAIAALGYADKVSEGSAKSAISAAKTLARNKMQLAELESALSAFMADQAEVNKLALPEVTRGIGGWWAMGDSTVRQTSQLFPNSQPGELLPERMKVLEHGWRSNRLSERGWNLATENTLKEGIYDTNAQIKRAQAKLDSMATQDTATPEQKTPENTGNAGAVVSQDEFPLDEATRSYDGISQHSATRARSDRDQFVKAIQDEYDAAEKVAETPEQRAVLESEAQSLKADYLSRYKQMMGVRSGAYSGFFVGRANLNVKQADKRNDALTRANETFDNWLTENTGRIKSAVLKARNADQLAAVQAAKDAKAADKERRDLALMGKILAFKSGDDLRFGTAIVTRVSLDKDGYPNTITVKSSDGTPLTNDKINLASEIFGGRGIRGIQGGKQEIRRLADIVRLGAGNTAEEGQNGSQAKTLIESEQDLWTRISDGAASVDEFKAGFENWLKNKAAILTELTAQKKDDLLARISPFMRNRYKSETKQDVAEALWRDSLGTYSLNSSVSYGMGSDSYENAVRRMVEATDAARLAQYADEVKAQREEMDQRRADKVKAIADPKTLDDYTALVIAKAKEAGVKTMREARMLLTPEQRATFDDLAADKSRKDRNHTQEVKQSVRVAGQTVDATIIETKHTQKGHDLFVVKLAERVERADYDTLNASAKKMGGYYSSFRGRGAEPGFQFTDRATAEAFVKLANGDSTDAQATVDERRDAFADDRSQSAAERLTEMADRLDAQADESLNADRKTNTARRAGFASAAEAAARAGKAVAKTMRNIAKALSDGTAKYLDRIRTKTQIDALQGYIGTAQYEQLKSKYPTYAEQEKRKGQPPDMETADFAEFPQFTAFRSDLASLARQMIAADGTKLMGQRLLKVADDVSEAFVKFAKENTGKLMRFRTKDGGVAAFPSQASTQAAIDRSGFKGKAIPFMVKRGEWTIITSPSEAITQGLWGGDGDKRITLTADFGSELVEKIGKANRRGAKVSVPWQFESAHDKRKMLARMGIETPAEFRAALREFIGLREQAAEADRVKMLERAMIGRRNDGLDFFPTPESVADEMISAADIQPDMAVLEPSAGFGHIADRIRAAGAEPDVIELSNDRKELLEEKGFTVVGRDFMDMTPRGFTYGDVFKHDDGRLGILGSNGGLGSGRYRFIPLEGDARTFTWEDRDALTGVEKRGSSSGYDRILMNPPFSDGRDMEHVQHAYTLLKPGGRLVALMGESAFTNQNKRATEFRAWLEKVGGTEEKLAEGSFMDPSLPVNTGANARMVVIEKPTGNDTDVVFSRGTPFYSELSRQIEAANINAAPGFGWKATIKGLMAKGVKADEITWSGIEEWLDLQTGKVTKAAVLGYLAGNGVQVTETTLGNTKTQLKAKQVSALSTEELAAFPGNENMEPTDWLMLNNGMFVGTYLGGAQSESEAVAAYLEEADAEMYEGVRSEGDVKYAKYQLPGGENYREVLMTLPIKPGSDYSLRPIGGGFQVVDPAGNAVVWMPNEDSAKAYINTQSAQEHLGGRYVSNHWTQPNVLAHIRVNDRVDADGKRVLFVEEIQSDFGQDAKKQRDAINRAVDDDFTGIIERMKKAGVLQVECD